MTAEASERAALRRRWERATNWPLMVAAVIFLAAYALPVLDADLPTGLLDLCRWLSWISWGIFVVELVVRLFLADERLGYLVRHWSVVLPDRSRPSFTAHASGPASGIRDSDSEMPHPSVLRLKFAPDILRGS
jgi:hypothetical protein